VSSPSLRSFRKGRCLLGEEAHEINKHIRLHGADGLSQRSPILAVSYNHTSGMVGIMASDLDNLFCAGMPHELSALLRVRG
jgi:hypothetical protein